MTVYLDVDDLLVIAAAVIGSPAKVRDYGLLSSAAARPQTNVFGQEAYPDPASKTAALLHSLCANHALIDGNKRLAWASAVTFVVLNTGSGVPDVNVDDAEAMMLAVAQGNLLEVSDIAADLRRLGVVN
ncbi:type II toxin-antitoxin system death-on-curing family toxin [Dactylosporangium darangshiense]|uniref:Type II toxin-antitoxin system death-on-curing family toxin n=1 Tax=Dactylosporangium darangshiense TaxID=579108 RepID=A0ABP8DRA1_9ACTN